MTSKSWAKSLLPALALGLAATACSGSPEASSTSTKVLTVAASAAVTTWDPVRSFSTEALYLGNVYEPLLWKNPAGSDDEYTPGLAESWKASPDGLSWTFNIRSGATFHDGEPVDAAAVKASIEAAQDHAGASFIWAPLKKVQTPDDTTVVMKLSYPAPMDLVAASTYGAWIVSPKALKASAKDETYFEEGIDAGSGPYTVADYVPGDEIVLQKYDEYWNDDAAGTYETIDISITPDAVTAQQMLTSGEVDYATSVPLENLDQLESTGDFEVRDSNSPFNFVALFNTTRPPLDDPQVRQALSYAMPYDDIIGVGAQGYGIPEPRTGAERHLPVLRGRADVRAGPGQGEAAARPGRPG